MKTLLKSLPDGVLALESPGTDTDADRGVGGGVSGGSFGVGVSLSRVPPTESGGKKITATDCPPTVSRRVTGLSTASTKRAGRASPNHAAAEDDKRPQSTPSAS